MSGPDPDPLPSTSRRFGTGRGPRPAFVFVAVAVAAAVVGLAPSPARALDVPPLDGRINDHAGLLSPSQRAQLDLQLAEYEKGTGHQLALLTVPSLEGDPIEDFSIRVVEEWKLGSEKEDDGLLILVAKEDRKMRIEVGYGLEGDLPDAIASRIIRDVMTPAFKRGDFYAGISGAFEQSMRVLGGESVQIAQQQPERRRKRGIPFIFYLMMGGFWLLPAIFGRRRRRGLGGFYIGGMGGGGGFGGGGFGGGGGGFGGGGGGFGGGGASGGW